jgi:hypothetical protein
MLGRCGGPARGGPGCEASAAVAAAPCVVYGNRVGGNDHEWICAVEPLGG